eukprot:6192561-Pleurochrysis_carterae.AAC.1
MSTVPKVGCAITAAKHSFESRSMAPRSVPSGHTRLVVNQISNMRRSGSPPYQGAVMCSSQLQPSCKKNHAVPEGGDPSQKSITIYNALSRARAECLLNEHARSDRYHRGSSQPTPG